jgi:hypothetical protein
LRRIGEICSIARLTICSPSLAQFQIPKKPLTWQLLWNFGDFSDISNPMPWLTERTEYTEEMQHRQDLSG